MTIDPLRHAIAAATRTAESSVVQGLLAEARPAPEQLHTARDVARTLVENLRARRRRSGGVDALMREFSLSSSEGVALMCLAEALLRIPDAATADALIRDKVSRGDWRAHLGRSQSLFVNAAAWGLMITGNLVATHSDEGLGSSLAQLIARGGEPLIRKAVDLAMRLLGQQFVTGQSIEEALANARDRRRLGYRYTFDMLGEAALTAGDADAYFAAYRSAIASIGATAAGLGAEAGPGISVKLSALHPRYCRAQRSRVLAELLPRLRELCMLAREQGMGLAIDAEESERLDLSLELTERLAGDAALAGWDGLGVVVQAYQKRAPRVVDWLIDLARRSRRRMSVRLVKGAYWDSEIKRAQVEGQAGYPVFTRKAHTDVCYLACAQHLLAAADVIYPQFATHNALTLATVREMARAAGVTHYEFQCLHGMGETLYDQVLGADKLDVACRIYAPVGSHETLLAYLVRRLLENGSNSSFVNQILDPAIGIDELLRDPVEQAACRGRCAPSAHSAAGRPVRTTAAQLIRPRPQRRAVAGGTRGAVCALPAPAVARRADAGRRRRERGRTANDPQPSTARRSRRPRAVRRPRRRGSGPRRGAGKHDPLVAHGIRRTRQDARSRRRIAGGTPGRTDVAGGARGRQDTAQRARRSARGGRLLPLLRQPTSRGGLRFRQRAASGRDRLHQSVELSARHFHRPDRGGARGRQRGAGQAGRTDAARSRHAQCGCCTRRAFRARRFNFCRATATSARCFAPMRGCAAFCSPARPRWRRLSTASWRRGRSPRRSSLVAETGGMNAMVVDSSSLPEQVVADVLVSAFDSAGQRCSALRVLCLQEEIAERVLDDAAWRAAELCVGDPATLSTDIGPVIDGEAQARLEAHIERMRAGHPVSGCRCRRTRRRAPSSRRRSSRSSRWRSWRARCSARCCMCCASAAPISAG